MSTPPSFDRFLHQATFFPGLNIRLGSLEATRKIIEAQLDGARTSEMSRQRHEHESRGLELHPDDREADRFDLQEQVLHLLPKALRGGFLVMLWAVLERTTHDIARLAMAHRGGSLAVRAFHKPYFVAASETLAQAAGLPAFPDTIVEQQLRRLQAVRNALVHHDGRQSAFPEPYTSMSVAELEAIGLYVVRDYDYSYIIPGEDYLKKATNLVYNHIHDTAQRVFNALVPQ